MQTLSVKNKSHRYLTKPVAFAALAYETGGSARSRNTVKARCFCGMDARVCYEKALLEPDDFPTSPLIKDVQRPIFSATMYIRKPIIVINVPPLSSRQCLSYPALPVQESLRHDTGGGRYASKICDGQVRLSIGIEDADDLIAVWSRHWHRSDRLRRIVEEAFVLLRFCL